MANLENDKAVQPIPLGHLNIYLIQFEPSIIHLSHSTTIDTRPLKEFIATQR